MIGYVAVAILALGLLGLAFRRLAGAYLTFRGKRVITCPACGELAAVELAAGRAAVTAIFRRPALRLRDCSRWSGRRDCGQDCLEQIEAAPEECLVRTILVKWYEGKSCTCCGRPLGEISRMQRHPGLMSPELRIFEWRDLQPEKIPRVLETHQPVCWHCLVAETHTW